MPSDTARRVLVPALLAAGASWTLGACRGEAPPPAPPAARPAAVVGGRGVPVEWVAAIARGEGIDRDPALRRAVEIAALGSAARAAGLDRRPSFAASTRAVFVRLLLRREVEVPDADALSDRDRADLEGLYRENDAYFVHPELRTVAHLLVMLRPSRNRRGRQVGPDRSDAEWKAGRAAIESIAPLAEGVSSDMTFQFLRPIVEARLAAAWSAAGLDASRVPTVIAEAVGPMAGTDPYDPAFLAASFALATAGDVSGPVRTAFGYHIVRLTKIDPPRNTAFAEATPETIERGRAVLEKRRTDALIAAARNDLRVVVHADRLLLTLPEEATGRP